jgi:hypothetical protein
MNTEFSLEDLTFEESLLLYAHMTATEIRATTTVRELNLLKSENRKFFRKLYSSLFEKDSKCS